MIDSKNSNVTEIVSQLGIASPLFSAGETRAEKAGVAPGNFSLVGRNWEYVYNIRVIAPMMSAAGETRRVLRHVLPGNLENWSTLGCNLVQSER